MHSFHCRLFGSGSCTACGQNIPANEFVMRTTSHINNNQNGTNNNNNNNSSKCRNKYQNSATSLSSSANTTTLSSTTSFSIQQANQRSKPIKIAPAPPQKTKQNK